MSNSQSFLVISRPMGRAATIDELKIVDSFAIESKRPLSNKQAAEHYLQFNRRSEIRARFGEEVLLECVPNRRFTF